MSTPFQCELISWNRVVKLALKLASQIRENSFEPDIIIAIGRGGYVPARLLADYLDLMDLTDIKIEHYQATKQLREAKVKFGLSADVTNKKVLLVDDVSDSGETFEVAIKHILQTNRPKEIRTVALHHKITSRFKPDFYAAKIIKWRWLIYPWAQAEDVTSFVNHLSPAPVDTKQASKGLIETYGIKVSDTLLEYLYGKSDGKH